MKTLLLTLGLCLAPMAIHEFYISILTIRFDEGLRTLDLTWQITAHDLEHALSDVADLDLGSSEQHPEADSLMSDYLQRHLRLALASGPLVLYWIGWELEGENLYCYLQVQDVEDARGLMVSNDLLHDVFPEQDNIVHVERAGHFASHHFLRGDGQHVFEVK